jgi:hypothetical protein
MAQTTSLSLFGPISCTILPLIALSPPLCGGGPSFMPPVIGHHPLSSLVSFVIVTLSTSFSGPVPGCPGCGPQYLSLPLLFLSFLLLSSCCSHGGSGHADGSMALVMALPLASFCCPFLSFSLSWCHLHGSCLTLRLWSSCHGVAHGAFPGVSKIQIPKIQ